MQRPEEGIHVYRVWMKDGYASLHNADTEEQAKELAVQEAKRGCDSCNMNPKSKEYRLAIKVDYVTKLG